MKRTGILVAALLTVGLFNVSKAQMEAMGLGFVAPQVNDADNDVANPAQGEIVFDKDSSATGSLKVYAGTDGWTTLGARSATFVAASTATGATTSTSGNYVQMTSGSSVTLTPGSWMLNGSIVHGNNGSSPAYTSFTVGWYGANGNNTATAPAAVNSLSGVTLDAGNPLLFQYSGNACCTNGSATMPAPTIRLTLTSTQTIYLVARPELGTPGNASIKAYLYAEKLD